VQGIAFWLPGKWTTDFYVKTALTGYSVKLIIAIALTPLIYLGHAFVKNYLGREEAQKAIVETAEDSLHHKVKE
jgi:queuosine precursor transporter